MKKYALLPLLILLLVAGCNDNKDVFLLEVKVKNLSSDRLLCVQEDFEKSLEFDTLTLSNDFVLYSDTAQSLSSLKLYSSDRALPIQLYVQNGERYEVVGDMTKPYQIKVKGSEINEDLNTFQRDNATLFQEIYQGETFYPDSVWAELRTQVEKFVEKEYDNPVASILLAQYMLDYNHPKRLRKLFNQTTPESRIPAATKTIETFLSLAEKSLPTTAMSEFSAPNSADSLVSNKAFLDRPTIYLFWDIEDRYSTQRCQEIAYLYEQYKDLSLSWVNLSVGADTIRWRDAVEHRTRLSGTQLYLPLGWSNGVISKVGVPSIPFCLLQDHTGTIVARNVYDEELAQMVFHLTFPYRNPKQMEQSYWGRVVYSDLLKQALEKPLKPVIASKIEPIKIPFRSNLYIPNNVGPMRDRYLFVSTYQSSPK